MKGFKVLFLLAMFLGSATMYAVAETDNLTVQTELDFDTPAGLSSSEFPKATGHDPVVCMGRLYFPVYDAEDGRNELYCWTGSGFHRIYNNDYALGKTGRVIGDSVSLYVIASKTADGIKQLIEVRPAENMSDYEFQVKNWFSGHEVDDALKMGNYVLAQINENDYSVIRLRNTANNTTYYVTGVYPGGQLYLCGTGMGYFYYAKNDVVGGTVYLWAFNPQTRVSTKLSAVVAPGRQIVQVGDFAYCGGQNSSGTYKLYRLKATAVAAVKSMSTSRLASINNTLFIHDFSAQKLYKGHIDAENGGRITNDTIEVVKTGVQFDYMRAINNALFLLEEDGQLYRSDGTGYGTVILRNDYSIPLGALGTKILINLPTNDTQYFMVAGNTSDQFMLPDNIKWAGLRSSYYGILDEDGNPPFPGDPGSSETTAYEFPPAYQWEAAAKASASYFPCSNPSLLGGKPGAQPTLVWIVTRPRVDQTNDNQGGCIVQMQRPDGLTTTNKIKFADEVSGQLQHDRHEAYLDYFDQAGIKLYVQLEPGWAPMEDSGSNKGLLSIVANYLIHQDQDPAKPKHACVEGIGVDVEWVKNCEEGAPEEEMGKATDAQEVARWYNNYLKPQNLKMFLKHYAWSGFLPNYNTLKNAVGAGSIGAIMFVNDSQGVRYPWGEEDPDAPMGVTPNAALTTLLNEFKAWADACPDSPVGFQIMYPNDWFVPSTDSHVKNAGWLNFMDDEDTDDGWTNDPADEDNVPKSERWKLIQKLGVKIAKKIPERDIGLFIVDFRSRMLFPNNEGKGIFEWIPQQ
ncbi:MAG: hypothetical protein EHM45_02945 [Desulfobacteraceae bacterium]|nr:MAG: hypothetical protein EHM45_02945 [Desulfobacteraceae bacterium]